MAVILGPAGGHGAPHNRIIAVSKAGAHITGEGKVSLSVPCIQIIIENAACSARLIPVFQMKIVITPFSIFGIIVGVMAITTGLERGMKRVSFSRSRF